MNVPEKHRAVAHAWVDGAEIEYRSPDQDFWYSNPDPEWAEEKEYRIKPTFPSFDWSQLTDSFSYIAKDSDGLPTAFEKLPIRRDGYWDVSSGQALSIEHFNGGVSTEALEDLVIRAGEFTPEDYYLIDNI